VEQKHAHWKRRGLGSLIEGRVKSKVNCSAGSKGKRGETEVREKSLHRVWTIPGKKGENLVTRCAKIIKA